ncbi:tubulin binding cofactor A [Dothidotthia symphoricarpi CBS 119687]|uniref:Tubulin-specific chaperone A n=1 Tax=Dothidotthia symphoricarpi CBS 119687 TaxID=1392245 RepID=A0A6A6A0G1_9PLEO|nr:tubulin binding cofactor A [Dothidotthia symphoricarpi CBS 119687]KAF2124178.1 tubulin binding cofactor A [Dothidotthia symphoricarpi CBS 119687]
MAPPSKLAISTSVVTRLVKEEASYHKEAVQQASRIAKLESSPGDENAEYTLRQERQALQETKNVLPSMKAKIGQAVERLEEELEVSGADAPDAEVTKAKEAIAKGKEAMQESA